MSALFRSDHVEIWEVRYPDVRRGGRGEPPYSTALFRYWENAEAFASRYKGKATIARLERTSEEVHTLQKAGLLEAARMATQRRGGGMNEQ